MLSNHKTYGQALVLGFVAGMLHAMPCAAGEFRSIAEKPAVMYDGPSLKARKIFVASRYLPVEVMVSLDQWVKVRDSSGELAWVEKRQLGEKRFVLVTVSLADIRQSPDDNAPLVFQAGQNVVLELLEPTVSGWIKVQHQDGQSGFVKTNQVWGA